MSLPGLEQLHGIALKAELEDYYETESYHSRLYPNCDLLVDKRLVEKGQRDCRTNTYVLTRRGRRELESPCDWENQYLDAMVPIS